MLSIPKCEVIDKLVEVLPADKLNSISTTTFIGVQHMLETTLSLFEGLIRCGVQPEHMFFTGKSYSNCETVINKALAMGIHLINPRCHSKRRNFRSAMMQKLRFMWAEFEEHISKHHQIDTIIILDEGGRCRELMPNYLKFKYRIALVEQTTGGLNSATADTCLFPVIDVARSAVKRLLEPPLIANRIIEELCANHPYFTPHPNNVIGIIGVGVIGSAIARLFTQKGFKVCIYDKQDIALKQQFGGQVYRLGNRESVIENADYIFGCSGYDITQGIDMFDLCKKDKTFISCSSEDKEFFSLLNLIYEDKQYTIDPQNNISLTTNFASTITILKGGFPINFDHSGISVKANDIQITRGLLLAGCMQALTCARKLLANTTPQNTRYMVDPYLQRFLVKCWEKEQKGNPYYQALFGKFQFLPWIIEQSNGLYDEKRGFHLDPEAISCSDTAS